MALLCLRSALRAQAELRRAQWALLKGEVAGGVLVLAPPSPGRPVSGVALSLEPGSVVAAGETVLAWSVGEATGSTRLVVSAARPKGVSAGPVRLGGGGPWWLPLLSGERLVGELGRLAAGQQAARAALEAASARAAELAYPGPLAPRARLAAVSAARSLARAWPLRPGVHWGAALRTELAGALGPGPKRAVPLGSLLAPLAERRRWPELPDARVLAGLLAFSSSLRSLAALLSRYDVGARLWSRAPAGMERAAGWLAARRAEARCVLTWADAGLLLARWCAESGQPAPAVGAALAEALLVAAEGPGFASALALTREEPAG